VTDFIALAVVAFYALCGLGAWFGYGMFREEGKE